MITAFGLMLLLLIGTLIAATLSVILTIAVRNNIVPQLAVAGGLVALVVVVNLVFWLSPGVHKAPESARDAHEVKVRSTAGGRTVTAEFSAADGPAASTTIEKHEEPADGSGAEEKHEKPVGDSATDEKVESDTGDPDWVTNPINEPSRVTVRSDRHVSSQAAQTALEMLAEEVIREKVAERVGSHLDVNLVDFPLNEVHRFSSDRRIVEKEYHVAVSIPLSTDDYEPRFERFMLLEFTPAFYAEVDRRWAEAVLDDRLRAVGLIVAAVLFVLIVVWASLKLSLSKRAAIDSEPMTN